MLVVAGGHAAVLLERAEEPFYDVAPGKAPWLDARGPSAPAAAASFRRAAPGNNRSDTAPTQPAADVLGVVAAGGAVCVLVHTWARTAARRGVTRPRAAAPAPCRPRFSWRAPPSSPPAICPDQQPVRIQAQAQGGQHPLKRAIGRPAPKPLVSRLPRALTRRQVPPRRPCAQNPQQGVPQNSVVAAGPTRPLGWEFGRH